MQALKASAVGSSCSKATSLPTQDGIGWVSPVLQFTCCCGEVVSTSCWAPASAHRTPPLLDPNTTGGSPSLAPPASRHLRATALERAGANPAGPSQGAGAQGTLRGHWGKPLSLRRPLQLGHWPPLWGFQAPLWRAWRDTPAAAQSIWRGKSPHLPFYWLEPGCSQLNSST